ncbi:HIR complex subunit [Elasticomyces elasticus]|nr:HIR complex subunit [Elasticomyces elasticus]KAK3624370.1 HIR complex subunit [Elasticomyces elasticus]KAK4910485.1 HIR complex subunit [Elasticomyces elasticus]KAK5745241.1 HIR complex subunit [Elasticomyces elasticus]
MPPGFDLADAASDQSSSSLSPPPPSTPHNADNITVARSTTLAGGVLNSAGASANGPQPNTSNTTAPANAPEKAKRQRKPKLDSDGNPIVTVSKPRKPRVSKPKPDGTTAAPRAKKVKIEEKVTHDAPLRQPSLTEMMGVFQQPMLPSSVPTQQQHRPSLGPPPSTLMSSRPTSSGQNYDPIRGATMETSQQRPANLINNSSAQTSPHVNRASASPSIASLIDPPMASTKTSMPAPNHYLPHSIVQQSNFAPPAPRSPTPPKSVPAFPHPPRPTSPTPMKSNTITQTDGAMDLDITCEVTKPAIPDIKTKSSSSGPTPKPSARPTPPPAPKGTGSGLLSSSNLFGGPSTTDSSERRGVNIDIHIKLDPAGGNNINIAQEIAKKYGRDAINPRAAAHREELLRVAAAANKIEGGSGADDMSVDLMSDAGGDDSNVEMGGMEDGEKSGTGADAKAAVRKRKPKIEEYDKEDDFIDDTELAWQEQAAVAKDGFFVYSGPLVPAGETANVESAVPTRGRGGGRGSRGGGRGSRGGAGANATTHASVAAEKAKDSATRGRARGRGTGAPRKPRITKADRERMETEKIERERKLQGGGPTGGGGVGVQSNAMAQPYGGPQGTTA